jgi:hypothetical protein|tara:strand:- start:2597 stop:2791 length:195 start_codon:yes stop_codon:yes gene_type:complete
LACRLHNPPYFFATRDSSKDKASIARIVETIFGFLRFAVEYTQIGTSVRGGNRKRGGHIETPYK